MPIIFLLEFLFLFFGLWVVTTQVVIPLWNDTKLFPVLRRKQQSPSPAPASKNKPKLN